MTVIKIINENRIQVSPSWEWMEHIGNEVIVANYSSPVADLIGKEITLSGQMSHSFNTIVAQIKVS